MRRVPKLAATLAAAISAGILAVPNPALSDIFQWEYINPANPSQGKQPSSTLCPDGAGVNAVPFAALNDRNLTMAYLIRADLSSADVSSTILTNADLSNANLNGASFHGSGLGGSTLAGANFTGAEVRGADFQHTTQWGFTAAQLYSTASYQNRNLTGISLAFNNLSGWNFSYANLTNVIFEYGTLTNALFRSTNVTSANFSYANLTNVIFEYGTLTNTNFSHANLTNANFRAVASLGGANFTDADVRGAYLASSTYPGFTAAQLYSTASYQNHDLTGTALNDNDLTGWNFSGQNLTNVTFSQATLTQTNFTGAQVRGANFAGTTSMGFTAAQLYSTASYQNHDLTGIDFSFHNDLSGWNFVGQDLTNANFYIATLTNANFTGAQVRGANFQHAATAGFTAAQLYSTASYQNHDLTGIHLNQNNLSGWNFMGQNLTKADFDFDTLGGANFTGAQVREARFFDTTSGGFTAIQLYSTASYQNHDLSGILLSANNLSGWNFSGQNLANATFYGANLTGADFSHANLTKVAFGAVPFYGGGTLTNANFTGAEIRGAMFDGATYLGFTASQLYSTASYQNHDLAGIDLARNDLAGWNFAGQNVTNVRFLEANLAGTNFTAADTRGALDFTASITPSTITTNLIRPNGHITGLDLTAGRSLVVRNYHGSSFVFPPNVPLPIVVDQHLTMDATGTLKLVFDADQWDSEIFFAPGIPVLLGGMLDLSFAAGVDVNAQIGRTFQIFNWTGVTPAGSLNVSSAYDWDISQLYTAGRVTLVPEPVATALLLPAGTLLLARSRRS